MLTLKQRSWYRSSVCTALASSLFLSFFLSCTSPPGLNSDKPKSSLAFHANTLGPVTKLPQDVFFSKGKLPASFPQTGFQPPGLDFKIQDYPQDCNGCEVLDLNVGLSWPQLGKGPTNTSIDKGSAESLNYGFKVLEWGQNASGQKIASLVQMGFEFSAGYGGTSGLERYYLLPYTYFSSTDGMNYTLSNPYGGTVNLVSFGFRYVTSTDSPTCAYQYGATPRAFMSSPSLKLDPIAETITLSTGASTSGPVQGSDWIAIPDSEPLQYYCANTGTTGQLSSSMRIVMKVPFVEEEPQPTLTPTPTAPPQCDMGNAPKAVPDDLNPLLDGLKNIPEGKPVPAKQAQNILQQLKSLQQQLNQSGVATQNFQIQGEKARSNQDKQQAKIIKEIAKLESKLENLQTQTLSDFQVFDQNYQSVVSLIQQYYDYELLRYDGNLHPNSLARYKTTLDRIAYARDYFSWSGNTYDLLYAGFIQTLEFQVYRMLVQDLLEQELPLTGAQDEPNYEFYSSDLNEIQTGEDLLKYLGKQLSKHTQNLELTQAHAQTNYDVFLGILPYETSRSAQPEAEDGDDSALPFSTQSSIRSPHLMPREMNLPLGDFRILRNPALVEYEGGGPGIPAGFTFGGGSVSPGAGGGGFSSAQAGALTTFLLGFGKQLKDFYDTVFGRKCEPKASGPQPQPQPTNLYRNDKDTKNLKRKSSDNRHRSKLRDALAEADERCSDGEGGYTPPPTEAGDTRNKFEQAHHIVPLHYMGMDSVHAILGFCKIDIDDPKNGECMDEISHNQTKTSKEEDSYVKQIMLIFRLENVSKADGSPDCDKVKDKLSRIKAHLKAQNLISQKGRASNVNLKGLEL